MKTYRQLYSQIYDFSILHEAFKRARKLKRYRDEVLRFSFGLEKELWRLHTELKTGTYRPGRYRHFVVRDSKKRLISAAPFRDRVVHKAIVMTLEPLLDPRFIYDSYACREGKGTHQAIKRLESMIKRGGASLQVTTFCSATFPNTSPVSTIPS